MPKVSKLTKRGLTPKQKKFLALIPAITTGKLTVEQALRDAGYSPSTARQQTKMVESVRHSSAMQEALRKAGVTEERVASKIRRGMDGFGAFNFTKLAAELLDGFPAKKIDHSLTDIDALLDNAEEGEAVRYSTDPPKKK